MSEEDFYLALESNNEEAQQYCLENSIGLNYINDTNKTPYHAIILHNPKLMNSYLDKINRDILLVKPNLFRYFIGDNETKKRLISLNNDETIENVDFRIFDQSEFKIINRIGKGTYGQVYQAKHQTLGFVAIKEYQNEREKYVGSIEEIIFYRMMNERTNVCPKLYGMFFRDDVKCLVMEMLYCTLSEIQELMITFSYEEKLEYLSKFMEILSKKVKQINYLGILNSDIKPENIMLDKNGNIKIIDFSISQYFGLNPSSHCMTNSITTDFLKSPEFSTEHAFYNPEIHSRRSLDTDIFAAGVSILNVLFNTKYTHFIHKDGGLYFGDLGDLEHLEIKRYENSDFLQKIFKIIDHNPSNRSTILSQVPLCPTSEKNRQTYNCIQYEMLYYNEIAHYCKTLIFPKNIIISQKFDEMMIVYEKIFRAGKVFTLDLIINTILKIPLMISKEEFMNCNIEILGFTCMMFQSYITDDFLNFAMISKICKCPEDECERYFLKLHKYEEMHTFIPITSCIATLTIKLQMIGIDPKDISTNIKKGLIHWAIFNNMHDINLYELILGIYYTLRSIPISFENLPPELIIKIRRILNNENRFIKDDILNNIFA